MLTCMFCLHMLHALRIECALHGRALYGNARCLRRTLSCVCLKSHLLGRGKAVTVGGNGHVSQSASGAVLGRFHKWGLPFMAGLHVVTRPTPCML